MSTTARFRAADVATAATAVQTRLQAQADGPDGIKIVNHEALYRSKTLSRFAAAAAQTLDAAVDLSAEDFDLIGSNLPQRGGSPAT